MSRLQPNRVQLFRRVPKEQAKHGFEQLGEDERLFTKPTLLCCGGSETNRHEKENGMHSANGYAKIGHALLGYDDHFSDNTAPIDIVSVLYPLPTMALQDAGPDYAAAEWRQKTPAPLAHAILFAEDHFFPLVEGADGKRLSLDQAKRNLRNVQVMAHSHGASFIRQVGDQLVEQMESLGYTPDEIRQATSQVLVFAMAPSAVPGGGKASFTTINTISRSDTEIGLIYPGHHDDRNRVLEKAMDALLGSSNLLKMSATGRKVTPAKALNIIPMRLSRDEFGKPSFMRDNDSPHCIAYFSQRVTLNSVGDVIAKPAMDPNMPRAFVDGHFHIEGNDIISAFKPDPTGHQVPPYVAFGIGSNGFMPIAIAMGVLINGMNNALRNQNAAVFEELAAPLALLSMPEKKLYTVPDDNRMYRFARGTGYDRSIATATSHTALTR